MADVAATRRLERIHVRQLLVRHRFYEGGSSLGLQSVKRTPLSKLRVPKLTISPMRDDTQINYTTG